MGKGGGGSVGGAGRIALGSQGIVIGGRLEEAGRSPRLAVAVEDEACGCVLGDIGFGIVVADEVDDCGSCRPLFVIIGLTSIKVDVRGS